MSAYREVLACPAGSIIETTFGPYTGLWLVTPDAGYAPGCSRERTATAVRIPGPVRSAAERHHYGWPS